MGIDSVRQTLAELGVANGLLYLLGRALQKASGNHAFIARYHFVAQPIPADAAPSTRPSAKSRVRLVGPDDPVVAAFPRPAHVIAQRFRDGATCFVAENDGEFAGYLWLARNAYEEDEVRCRYEFGPPALCAWDYDVFVAPRYRAGRTFARLWDAANAHLAAQGVRWSLSRISTFNAASMSAHQRLGIEKLSSATFVVLGPFQFALLPDAPYVRLDSALGRRPVIRLAAPAPQEPA